MSEKERLNEDTTEYKNKPRNFKWYLQLKKSKLNPPSWVFPIVWTILYIMLIFSFIVFNRKNGWALSKGMVLYILQWIFNLIWSPLFFRKKLILIAFIDIVALYITVVLTIVEFYSVDKFAAQLLFPYISWLTLATYLNGYVVVANPQFWLKK